MIEGQPAPKNIWSSPLVEWSYVMPAYFHAARIPLIKGRDFTPRDDRDASDVAIINQAMARRFWPNQDPVGKRFAHTEEHPKWITVVGVVGDVLQYGLNQAVAAPEAFFPEFQGEASSMYLLLRTSENPLGQVSAVRAALRELDSQIPLAQPRELSEVVRKSTSEQRFVALLLGLFAGLALLLAAVGIYGVIAYSVAQRTHEFGVRMALGAARREVATLVLGEGLRIACTGVAAGLVGAWGLTRFISSLLYGVKATDPITFAAISLLLAAVALLASYVPAHRATRVDPTVALRYE